MRRYFYGIILLSLFALRCTKETEKDPSILTISGVATSGFTFTVTGNIQEIGSYTIQDYGFIYSFNNSNPDVYSSDTVSMGKKPQTGNFQKIIAPTFSSNTYYSPQLYLRTYLTNSKGTVYGKVLQISLLSVSVNSVVPLSGKVGDHITITGTGFSSTPEYNNVEFNGITAQIISASPTQLIVAVPNGITSYNYYPYNNTNITIYTEMGTIYATQSFGLLPTITGMSPANGTFGTMVTITGSGFVPYNYYTVLVGNTSTSGYANSSTSMTFSIPSDVNSRQLSVLLGSNGGTSPVPGVFTMNDPLITSFSPSSGSSGTYLTITGQNFNTNYYYNTLTMGGITVSTYYGSSGSQVYFNVPSLSLGSYTITVFNGITSVTTTSTFTVQ